MSRVAAIAALPRRAIGCAALAFATIALGLAPPAPAAAQDAPPPAAAELGPVPLPNLGGMDEAVVAQLSRARADLDATLARPDALPEERAAAYGRLGQLYLLYELYDASEAALAHAEALSPEDPRWSYYRGAVAEETGRLDAAARHFERVLELRPDDVPSLLHLGRVQIDRNLPEEAERRFERARELDPESAAANHGLAQADFQRGRFERAVERFEEVLAAQPEATLVHYQLGLAYRELGKLDQAREHLGLRGTERVRFGDPLLERLGALATGAGIFLTQGNQAFAAGDYELAAGAYRRAVEEDPEDLTARSAYASALARSGREDEAIEQFRRVLQADADHVVSHFNLGTLLVQRGEVEEAFEHFHRAVELDPEFADAHFNLATSFEGLGQWQEAVASYSRVLEIDPQDTAARFRRARLLDRAGRPEEAERELEALAAANPDDPEVRRALGTLLGRLGRFRAAAEHLDRAVELSPADEETHFGRAMALLLGGLESEAAARLEESLAALPESLPLAHLLARVRAAATDPAVRDGERALALAERVLRERPSLDHAETLAMALAESGRFEDAAALQRQVLERARASGPGGGEELTARGRRLAAYERGEPVRAPWQPQK